MSIIIPFYNSENYLSRAIQSVINQTWNTIELVLVNDGSADGSLEIAHAIAKNEERIIVLDGNHSSIGHARNKGLAHSSGQFITFLDSDDELMPEAIEQMVRIMESDILDAVICNSSTDFSIQNATQVQHSLSGKDAAINLCREKISRVVWGKMYKSSIAKKVSFPEGIWFEDGPYLLNYFYQCSNPIGITKILVVQHFSRPESVTRRLISGKRIEDTYAAFSAELEMTLAYKDCELLLPYLFGYYRSAFMDNLVMLTTDRKSVDEISAIQDKFDKYFRAFLEKKKQLGLFSGPKTRFYHGLMSLHEIVGWKIFYSVLPIFAKRLFKKIEAIRGR